MKYMFILLATFKIIKKKLTKIQETMGFQTSHATKRIAQPIFIAKEESSDAHERSLILRALNLTDNNLTNSNPIPSCYDSWLARHPSALHSFDRLMKAATGKRIIVFLDYDGTLSPIVNDPDRAFMSDEMRAAVSEIASYFPTAIISGRSREKVKDFVKLNNLYYAGSHGMDIMAPPSMPVGSSDSENCDISHNINGNGVPFQPAKKFLPAIRELLRRLENEVKEIEGAKLEDNGFCISVHFRHVLEKDFGLLEEKVKCVLEMNPQFHLTEGIKVMEIRPSIEWNKGNAVEYFLDTLGLSNSSNVLPVYIGDDRTDEDAFKVIKCRGQGYPIIVSSTPRETNALYSLRDPSEVLIFLSRLAKWRKNSYSSRPLNLG